MKFDFLLQRQTQGELNSLDIYFAQFMADLAGTSDAILINTFANLSHAQSNQNSCLDISRRTDIQDKLRGLDCVTEASLSDEATINTPLALCHDDTNNSLSTSGPDSPGNSSRLYLQRYHHYETNIARQLISRNQLTNDGKSYVAILDELFPEVPDGSFNWQKVAAFQSVTRKLTVITGGPGTGKTNTIVRILAALLSQNPDLKIRLAAPTGKAAAGLNESIRVSLPDIPKPMSNLIPTDVSTIHRLLGMRADGHSFKYNKHNRISADLLVLDEVSMIDLAMFDRVMNAITEQTQLILLGDPNQLPSVDSGSVLSDLARLGVNYDSSFMTLVKQDLAIEIPRQDTQPHKLTNAFCQLKKNYRFADGLGIGTLAEAIYRQVKPDFASNDQVRFVTDYTQDSLVEDMFERYQPYLAAARSEQSTASLIDTFDMYQVLVPVRDGDYGVVSLNSALEALIHPTGVNPFYHGKPIIITRNDYNLRLFNGDVGICVQNQAGDIKVAFRGEDGDINYYLASRLPPFETCFVMTVHKAQGSEFENVSLVLPKTTTGLEELLTRELIYTGLTRAKSHVDIYAISDGLSASIAAKSTRFGGLTERFVIREKPRISSQGIRQLSLFDN